MTSHRFVRFGTALALPFLFSLAAAVRAQHMPAGDLIQRSGKYSVELRPPTEGFAPGKSAEAEIHILGPGPVEAQVTAELTMPAMPGMAMKKPEVRAERAPGIYHVALAFPHGGEYRLSVMVRPAGEKAFTVAFRLNVHDAGMGGGDHSMHMMAPFAGIPMTREASGTSWQPDSTPMHGSHRMSGLWMVMQHYNAFLAYDHQSGPREDDEFDGIGWYMFMASRPVGKGELTLRAMLSPEPATVSRRGYPLLFQSGESYGGNPIVDRQHAHDFFMETAARYRHPLGDDTALSLYLAASGEPALGPTAMAHRLSAMDIPAAPITHHWQDSTHITFGVATLGASRRNVQVEGSVFTGREPDEHRWNFDRMKFDSYSGRVSYNPGANWSLQASYGYLHSPEALHPADDVRRTTVSAIYNRPVSDGGNWVTTAVWGRNRVSGLNSDAFLLETDYDIANRNTLFGRLEHVDKLGEDLAILPADRKVPVTELTLGGIHELPTRSDVQTGIGVAVTFNWKPKDLDAVYGKDPMGFWIFLRIRPGGHH